MKKALKSMEPQDQRKPPGFEGLYGVLFLILAGLIFLNSGIFVIKEVEVKGNQEITTEDVLLTTRLNLYKNIFQIDASKIKKEILQNPKIAMAEVTRVLPHKILITIRERQPLCLLLYLDNLLIIGEDAVVMEIKDENEPINLPIVTGVELKKVKLGGEIFDPRFQEALEILKYADENLRQMTSEINLKNFQLYLDIPASHHTLKVELGNTAELDKKIYNLRAILSHTSPDELQKIDLRAPDLPTVIKFKK